MLHQTKLSCGSRDSFRTATHGKYAWQNVILNTSIGDRSDEMLTLGLEMLMLGLEILTLSLEQEGLTFRQH